jgi:HEAT repeat protein
MSAGHNSLAQEQIMFTNLCLIVGSVCLVLLMATNVQGDPIPETKIKLPQRLMTAEELLREIHAQTGLYYAYPTGALARQIDTSPFNGEASVKALVGRLGTKAMCLGGNLTNLLLFGADDLAEKEIINFHSPNVDSRRAAVYEMGNAKSSIAGLLLKKGLDDKDESVRYHALRSFVRLERDYESYRPEGRVSEFLLVDPPMGDRLVEILKAAPDRSCNEWIWAAKLLGQSAFPLDLSARAELEKGLKHDYIGTRRAAENALTGFGQFVNKPLRPTGPSTSQPDFSPAKLLKQFTAETDVEKRAELLLALGQLGGRDVWDLLLKQLDVPDPVIRKAAIRALARCPDPRAIAPLMAILTGDESAVLARPVVTTQPSDPLVSSLIVEYRNLAAMSLGRIGGPEVIKQLGDYVAKAPKPISVAALALSWTEDPAAESALLNCMKPDADQTKPVNDSLRCYADIGLARIGLPAAVDAIMKLDDAYDNVERYMGHSAVRLAGAWSPAAVEHLIDIVRKGKGKIAPHGLEMAEDPRAVDVLIEIIPKSDGARLDMAIQALGRIGDPRAVPTLLTLLDHKEGWVRYEALRALRWRWYWHRADVQAALKKHPTFRAFVEPQPTLADQPANTWVCRSWPVDFDDDRVVNTSYEAGMVFDESTGRAVKSNGHGQRCDSPQLGETWLYDPTANTWKLSQSAVVPFGMCGTWEIAYDRANRKVVFQEFEGGNHGWQMESGRALRPSSPWVYDGAKDSWTSMNPLHTLIGPGMRGFTPMVYVDSIGKVFLHGGKRGGDTFQTDRSWTYDTYSNTWTLLPESKLVPATRRAFGMCYLPGQDKVLISPAEKDTRTWLFDPKTNQWADAGAKGEPPKFGPPVVYDPVSRSALAFRAEPNGTEVWRYDPQGNEWSNVHAPADLSPHHDSVDVCYDPADNVFIMDGGHISWETDHIAVREVWTYKFKQSPSDRHSTTQADVVKRITPPIVGDVVVSVLRDRTTEVRWSASPAKDVVGYNVYAATVKAGSQMNPYEVFSKVGQFDRLNDSPIKGATFIDSRPIAKSAGLFNHEIRAYYVEAIDSQGRRSGPSAIVLNLTGSVPRLQATMRPDGSTLLTWQPATEKDIRGYAIYRMDEYRRTLAIRLNPVPVTNTKFVDWCDSSRAERRRYYVVAIDALSQEGLPSTGAWAFGRP